MRALLIAAAAGLLLAACGERPQMQPAAKQGASNAPASQAWTGTTGHFKSGQWTPGDQASWERQMRVRIEGQNEYVRIQGRGGN